MCAGRPGEIVEVTMTRYFMLPKVTEITPESARPAGPARPADGRYSLLPERGSGRQVARDRFGAVDRSELAEDLPHV
jgi:hypothetical protein